MSFSVLLLVAIGGSAANPSLARYTFAEPHMGTRFQIILYAADEATAKCASRAAFDRIVELDRIMSDYSPTSELMRLCRKAGHGPVAVSKELFFVLSYAQEVSRCSHGAFDVTVGPIVRLWRRARRTQRLPEADQLDQARRLVGNEYMHLDKSTQTVRLDREGMRLDLGGIGKGYAADEALATLDKRGIKRALVAAGGDIAVSGPPADASYWTIGIAPLDDPDKKPSRYVLLHHAAVSTSGDFEQHAVINGKRYSHILDPRTGMALIGRQSATVTAPRGIMADSLTKVIAVAGPERGFPVIDSFDGAAAYVVRESSKGVESFESKRWTQVLQKTSIQPPAVKDR